MRYPRLLTSAITIVGTLFSGALAHDLACKPVEYKLSASGINKIVRGEVSDALSTYDSFTSFVTQDNGSQQVNGTYTIKGTYCPPQTKHPKHESPLLLFVHGITYSRTYWSSLDTPTIFPNKPTPAYNWVDYASKRGYASLSIDRLGDGGSSHPDWHNVLQAPFSGAISLSLVHHLQKHHSHMIWVGHSYGSILATYLAALSPTAISTYILTGIAQPGPNDNSNIGLYDNGDLTIASVFDPARFPPSKFGDGYIVTASKSGRAGAFYSVPGRDFDPAILDKDYDTMQTVGIAEFLFPLGMRPLEFNGRVFGMTGDVDAVFCGNATLGQADCADGRAGGNKVDDYLADSWAGARVKESYLQRGSGHDLLVHFRWEDGVRAAHEFLERK